MTHRSFALLALAACLAASPAAAQSRMELQITLDMRVLQSQVQQLAVAVNALSEKIKGTDARLEAQASALAKGFSDQKLQIEAIAAQQRALTAGEGESAVRVLQLQQEMKTILQALTLQQTTLNEILTQLQQPTVTAPAGTDPAAPAAPPRTGAQAMPASPSAVYKNAFGYFYGGQYDNAIDTLKNAIERFPESPDAAKAQLTIGDAYDSLGGHNAEALAAYGLVIKNYKDPDVVADAYYKQGAMHEKLSQKDNAIASYKDVIRLYPNSSAAVFATTALKRLGIIK